jgi:hypothetical protein
MQKKELKQLCKDVLCAIKSGKIDCVEKTIKTIEKNHRVERVNKNIYPDLTKFQFTQDDLNELRNARVIDDENRITKNALEYVIKTKDPLLKLLYGQCWKINDELKKPRNILNGVRDMLSDKLNRPSNNFVLYQFGRHIACSPRREPLVDQHSMRAFQVLRLKKSDCVSDYIQWFNKLPKKPQFRRAVDELLLVFGKAVKIGTSPQADA